MTGTKILRSKQEIMGFLGPDCSDYLFDKYIKKGMPARYEDQRWMAHADNIDRWFKEYTNVSMRKLMDKIPSEKPCQ